MIGFLLSSFSFLFIGRNLVTTQIFSLSLLAIFFPAAKLNYKM